MNDKIKFKNYELIAAELNKFDIEEINEALNLKYMLEHAMQHDIPFINNETCISRKDILILKTIIKGD